MSTWSQRRRRLIAEARALRAPKLIKSSRLTEEEYLALSSKVLREFPIRVKLAKMLGISKLVGSPLGGCNLGELYLLITLWCPERVREAMDLIKPVWSFDQSDDKF